MGNYYVPNMYYIIYIHIMSYIKISTGIQAIHTFIKYTSKESLNFDWSESV